MADRLSASAIGDRSLTPYSVRVVMHASGTPRRRLELAHDRPARDSRAARFERARRSSADTPRGADDASRRGPGSAPVVSSVAQQRSAPSRVGARKASHARAATLELCVGDALTSIEERGQLVRRQLAEPSEPGTAGKRSDADQAHRLAGREAIANPGQELNEIQLIEEIVLEPQEQLVVRLVTLDGGPPLPQIVDRLDVRGFRTGEVACSDVDAALRPTGRLEPGPRRADRPRLTLCPESPPLR